MRPVRLVTLIALLLAAGACRRQAGQAPAADPPPDALALALHGQVVDRAGNPVPFAQVFVWLSGQERLPAHEQTTDAEGRFLFAGVSARFVSLLIQTAGLGAQHLDRVEVTPAPVTVKVEGEGRTIDGRVVLRDGARLSADTRVLLGGANLRGTREIPVAAEGSFRFAGLGAGQYAARAVTANEASPPADVTLLDAAAPAALTLVLAPAARVTGRVVDARGQALPGVAVEVRDTSPVGGDCPDSALTDVVGYFATRPLPEGVYIVTARLPGYVGLGPETAVLAGRAASVNVRLLRAAKVTGRVVGPDGQPLLGAQVALRARSAAGSQRARVLPIDRVPVLVGPLPLAAEAARQPPPMFPEQTLTHVARSREDGRFELSDVVPGRFVLHVEHSAAQPFDSAAREVAGGASTDFGTLTLHGAGGEAGR